MENRPKVSIITVCYNVKAELSETIESVASQTYNNIEYIVIDGGSKDGSLEIIRKNSKYITKWISESDYGIYDAMNKGINLASGEWILFMNAGDLFYNNRVIENIFSINYAANVGIVYGDVEFDFGSNRKYVKYFGNISNDNIANELCHQGLLTRATILKSIKYDTKYKICADRNSFIYIHKTGWIFKYVPVVFATFEIKEGISSSNPLLSFNEVAKINDYSKLSYKYIRGLIKAAYMYCLIHILPRGIYSTLRYWKLKKNPIFRTPY